MNMPRSVEEILQHAEQMAAHFEDFDPAGATELNPRAVKLLRKAVQQRSDAERHIIDAIKVARDAGLTWSSIGTLIGTSGEAARQRYGRLIV